jgi:hypothetical protein
MEILSEFGIEGGLVKSSNVITLLKQYREEDKVIHARVGPPVGEPICDMDVWPSPRILV